MTLRASECLSACRSNSTDVLDPRQRRRRALGRIRRGGEAPPLAHGLPELATRAPPLGLQRFAADLTPERRAVGGGVKGAPGESSTPVATRQPSHGSAL